MLIFVRPFVHSVQVFKELRSLHGSHSRIRFSALLTPIMIHQTVGAENTSSCKIIINWVYHYA